jgi:cysteine desulfurase family protein
MIYLDNAATTFPKPESVYLAMDDVNRNHAFNAGRGSYRVAQEASALIDETKARILKLVHAGTSSRVVFTPSITIALNEIIQGVDLRDGDNIYLTPYEHNAVARVCELVSEKKKVNIIQMPVIDGSFEIDIEKTKYLFTQEKPKLVCCTHVSNVTGYILPTKELFEISKQYDAVTVLDTAQSLGIIDINANDIKADYIAFAGHKSLYGPLGVGGFIAAPKLTKLHITLAGGTGSDSLNLKMPESVPGRYEYASTNIVAIAGLNAALKEVNVEKNYVIEKELTKKTVEVLTKIPNVIVYAPSIEKHIGVISFNVKGYIAEDIGFMLDQDYEIAVRTGYHCAPFIHRILKDEKYIGTVRIGLSKYNNEHDIATLANALRKMIGET